MSWFVAGPEAMAAAARDLAGIGSAIAESNGNAAAPTTAIPASAADAVSGLVAQLYSAHAQTYQDISAQMASFHDQFVRALNSDGAAYANAESAAAAQLRDGLNAINAPARQLLGQLPNPSANG
ncbi:PE family protein [Mycobacterium asiaticum]|uniref:PE domain-containing protein n=1 Tax=Mycobacterium asiaticum TaxID=1790 RepID=A0A1A3NBE3_MYCAS|nr:PE family protein [Mycobacterium asiaticum]OBK19468.1 hypothetical protein A5636_18985 [Mycobacterium asiaticum]